MIKAGRLLSQKYETVVTNPPYMGSGKMDQVLKKFIGKEYPDSKADLFATFIERFNKSLSSNGYTAMVTMQSWMFLKSFESLRNRILNSYTIINLMHMQNNVMGIAFGTAVAIFENISSPKFIGTYHQINSKDVSHGAPMNLPILGNRFNRTNQSNFEKIPGSPIAYWASKNLIHDFELGIRMDELVEPKVGLQTGDNYRFLRQWFEVSINKIKFDANSTSESIQSNEKWFPYNKGGSYRKWYGNYDYVVNWQNDGAQIRRFVDADGKLRSRPQNAEYYFHEAITWSLITSGGFSMRYRRAGSIHDVSGMSAFGDNHNILLSILGLMNTPISNYVFKLLNPTINLQIGNFNTFPILKNNLDNLDIQTAVNQLISDSRTDWDSFETSWDFQRHPLLQHIDEHKKTILNKVALQQALSAKFVPKKSLEVFFHG